LPGILRALRSKSQVSRGRSHYAGSIVNDLIVLSVRALRGLTAAQERSQDSGMSMSATREHAEAVPYACAQGNRSWDRNRPANADMRRRQPG
jgi:hypothetical protein